MDRILDQARTGPLYLCQPEIASMVVEATVGAFRIHYREHSLVHYHLPCDVVRGNPVHLLITPRVPVSKLMQTLNRVTAREGHRILGRTGRPFWQDESYDRVVRETEFRRIARYIEMNPVTAGIAATPEVPLVQRQAD